MADWVNVVPITAAGRVVMIRQYRHGTGEIGLEIPGGVIDPGEEPLAAARRELREETGYGASELAAIGQVAPNPALQDNRCYSFVARGAFCERAQALDAGDEANGCVRYIRASHRAGLRPHARTATLGFSRGITEFGEEDLVNEVKCPAEPGDLLAHHAWTIHRAEANTSPRSRRALGFIFYGESAREDATAHEAYQKLLAAELAMEGRI